MSAWELVASMGFLLLALQESCAVVKVTDRKVAAEGSSMLLDAPAAGNSSFTEWEYRGTSSSALILQHYPNSREPTINPAYQGRVVFYPENGSILLQRLQDTDSGVYKATVDLMQDQARTTLLEVIKPVPQPKLQWSSNLAGSPIELVCMVPEGTMASISWKKEGRPLPPEKFHLLSGNIMVLHIRNGEVSDCGSYSCNVSNIISWKETVLNLTVAGLTPPLHHVQRLAVISLMFIAVSVTSFIILLCQPWRHRFGKEAQKPLMLFGHGLLCVSSLLLLAATIIWMQERGLSAAFILFGLFFFTAVTGTAQAAAAVLWRPAALSHFKLRLWHRVIQHSTAPTTLIVNLLFSTLLLHNTQQLHEQGCSEAVDVSTSCVWAALAMLLMLLLLFLPPCCHRKMVMKNQDTNHIPQVMATLVVEQT